RLRPLFGRQCLVFGVRLPPIAVMRLVVDDDDVLLAGEISTDSTDHLVRVFLKRTAVAAVEDRLRQPRRLSLFAQEERVVIGNRNPRLAQSLEQVGRKDIALTVIVAGISRRRTRKRSRIVMPGVTIRNASEKRASCRFS